MSENMEKKEINPVPEQEISEAKSEVSEETSAEAVTADSTADNAETTSTSEEQNKSEEAEATEESPSEEEDLTSEQDEFEQKIERKAQFYDIKEDDSPAESTPESEASNNADTSQNTQKPQNSNENQGSENSQQEAPDLKIIPMTEEESQKASESDQTGENAKKDSKKKFNFNRKLLWLLAIPVAAGAIYGGTWYKKNADWYSEHFYPDTMIGNIKVGEMTVDEAEAALTESLGDYKLKIKTRDTEEVLTAEDIGQHFRLEENGNRYVAGYMDQQSPAKWLFEKNNSYLYEQLNMGYDKSAVEASINRLSCVNPTEVVEAADAYIEYDEEEHKYSIVPEHPGNKVNRATVASYVYDSLDQWQTELTIPESDFPQPEITADDESMNSFVNEVEKYLTAEITLSDGDDEVVINRDVIIDFLDIDEEERTVELVERRVRSYINNTLDGVFDTVGKSRTITTDLSGTFTVSGGSYGRIVSTADELPQLMEEIASSAVVTREPNYRQEEKSSSNGGVGDTYVDVNLSMQRLSYVKNGEEILQSDFVSGKMSGGHATPTGTYSVAIKRTEYTMVKYNAFVHYWMNFNPAVGVGFHDASWRGSFGGTIYKNSGSHGCINMPYENAKKLYNNIDYGCPVVVHW